MRIAIIKYNGGNTQSVSFALARLGVDFIITDDSEQIQKADKVIFPGVGEAKSTMEYLKSRKLDTTIKSLRQPVLGICLGMQIMCRYTEENYTECLGIFDEDVQLFVSTSERKVPHMGWNQLRITGNRVVGHRVIGDQVICDRVVGDRVIGDRVIGDQLSVTSSQLQVTNDWLGKSFDNQNVYYVHSFYVPVNKYTSAITEYGVPFSAAMRKDNFYAVQFHPEKSAEVGSRVLETFISI